MSMLQDHDMDELFRDKLDGFEIAPSKNSWASIAHELEATAPRKKRIAPVLRIAASVTVLLGVGLTMWIAKDKAPGKPTGGSAVAVTTPIRQPHPVDTTPAAVNQPVQPGVVAVKPVTAVTPTSGQLVALRPVKSGRGSVPPIQDNAAVGHESVAATDLQPINTDVQQTVLAAVGTNHVGLPVNTTELPGAAALNAPSVIDTGSTFKPSPAVLAMVKPKATDKAVHKRHGIHNMGDLFNIMIASVDKRADKLVEFSEKDDESSITGVNLGFIKIKKDK